MTTNDMTPTQFKRWQKRMGWSVSRTATELCMQVRQVYCYRSGEVDIPATIERLCVLLEHVHKAPFRAPAKDGQAHGD